MNKLCTSELIVIKLLVQVHLIGSAEFLFFSKRTKSKNSAAGTNLFVACFQIEGESTLPVFEPVAGHVVLLLKLCLSVKYIFDFNLSKLKHV